VPQDGLLPRFQQFLAVKQERSVACTVFTSENVGRHVVLGWANQPLRLEAVTLPTWWLVMRARSGLKLALGFPADSLGRGKC